MENLGGPGFAEEYSTIQEEVRKETVEEELVRLRYENHWNFEALKLLVSICKSRNFDPFEGDSDPLPCRPCEMSKEELIERNKEATARVEKTKGCKSADAIARPTFDEELKFQEERIKTSLEDAPIQQLLEALSGRQVIYVNRYGQ